MKEMGVMDCMDIVDEEKKEAANLRPRLLCVQSMSSMDCSLLYTPQLDLPVIAAARDYPTIR